MRNARGIGRASVVAVGLGFGAALAAAGVASADPTGGSDAIVGSAAAVPFDFSNFAVNIDGIPIFSAGNAVAQSGFGGIAIADGAHSTASATGFLDIADAQGVYSQAGDNGTVDLAGAYGANSQAVSSGAVDAAFANGSGSLAHAGGVTPSTLGYVDAAFANGDSSAAVAGGVPGAAGTVDLASATGTGVSAFAQSGPFDAVFEPTPVAATPADSVAGLAAGAPAEAFDPSNFAVSIDGIPLFHEGTASASSVFGGIAIADGAGSSANADGFLDIATAQGVDSTANTLGTVDLAGATGNGSEAIDNPGAVDAAFANGINALAETGGSQADPGYVDAAFANGNASEALAGLLGTDPTGGSIDLASATGNGIEAVANAGPFDAVFEPTPAAAELLGDGLGSTASLSDFWSELLTLF